MSVLFGLGQGVEELHSLIKIGLRLLHGVELGRLLVGHIQILDRLVCVGTEAIVIGQQFVLFFEAIRVKGFYGFSYFFMNLLSPFEE